MWLSHAHIHTHSLTLWVYVLVVSVYKCMKSRIHTPTPTHLQIFNLTLYDTTPLVTNILSGSRSRLLRSSVEWRSFPRIYAVFIILNNLMAQYRLNCNFIVILYQYKIMGTAIICKYCIHTITLHYFSWFSDFLCSTAHLW